MRLLPAILCAVMAVVTIGIGGWVLLSASGSTTLRCDRASTSCVVTVSKIRGSTTRRFALGEAQQASVQETTTTSGGGPSRLAYRVVIDTTSGAVPVGDIYSPGRDDKQSTADSFNAYLANPQQAVFEYRTSGRNLSLLGLAFLGFGGIFVGIAVRQVVSLRQAKADTAAQVSAPAPARAGSRAGERGESRSTSAKPSSDGTGAAGNDGEPSRRAARRRGKR